MFGSYGYCEDGTLGSSHQWLLSIARHGVLAAMKWCRRVYGVLCAVGILYGGVRIVDGATGWYDMIVLEARG